MPITRRGRGIGSAALSAHELARNLAADAASRRIDLRVFRYPLAAKPGFDHRVHRPWRFLLNPVGDAGKDAKSEIGNILLCPPRGANAEGNVPIAPEKKRWRLDWGARSFAGATQAAIAESGAIPVDHRPEPAGSSCVLAIDFKGFVRKSLGMARSAANALGDYASLSAAQQEFREPRQLKEEYVPGLRHLDWPAQLADKASWMRQVENDQPLNYFRCDQRNRPGKRAAPIVSDQENFFSGRRLDESNHISNQRARCVGRNVGWRIRPTVATQVRRPDPISKPGQQRHLVTPGIGMLGEAMQAESESIALARGSDFEVYPVGRDAYEFDIGPTGNECSAHVAGPKFAMFSTIKLTAPPVAGHASYTRWLQWLFLKARPSLEPVRNFCSDRHLSKPRRTTLRAITLTLTTF